MAKLRAQRRALREAERAQRIEAARIRNERHQQRSRRRVAGQPSLIAHTRRTRARLSLFLILLINALIWIVSGDWGVQLIAFVLSALLTPMIAVLFVRSHE